MKADYWINGSINVFAVVVVVAADEIMVMMLLGVGSDVDRVIKEDSYY